jgi:hypothetical protein
MDDELFQRLLARSVPAEQVWRTVLPPLREDWVIRQTLESLPRNPADEDHFFEAQPPKVVYKQGTEPRELVYIVESFNLYQDMLHQIQRVAPQRFKTMHKGTPYYLMGWLAFAMKDYEKAVFFMDAALSEDLANNPNWANTPASSFLMIGEDYERSAAPEIARELRHEVDNMMRRFSHASPHAITTKRFVDWFIKPNAADPAYRAIATSFNTFVLERKERLSQIKIRSSAGGSIEPFLTHLFKGALIFESILKRKLRGTTLGECLSSGSTELGLNSNEWRSCRNVSLQDVPGILDSLGSADFQERNIAVTYALRNTTGHDLGWSDIFQYSTYSELTGAIENSILWAVYSLFRS